MRPGSFLLATALCLALAPAPARADALADALAAMNRGDLRTALTGLRGVVRTDPLNAEAHFWLGQIALQLGDVATAEFEAEGARSRGFDPHRATQLLARALLAGGKFSQLLDTVKPDGQNDAFDATIQIARGEALAGLHRMEDAQSAFATAERLDPKSPEPLLADARLAIARGNPARAATLIDQAIAAKPEAPEPRMAKAQLLRRGNDNPGALAVLDALIRDQPGFTPARVERASLELATGQRAAATADIDSVLTTNPGNLQAIYLRAVLQMEARDYAGADITLSPVAAELPRLPRGLYVYALVKEKLGQLETAEASARKFLARAPDDLEGQKLLARVQFAKRQPDAVITTLASLVDAGQGDAEACDLLARAEAATGRNEAAVRHYGKAIALAPRDAGLHARRASAHLALGNPTAAVNDLRDALALAPRQPGIAESLFFAALATTDPAQAQDALARIRATQGETDVVRNLDGAWKLASTDLAGAEASFRALLAKSPDFLPARVNLARVLTMLGQRDDSIALLDEWLKGHPAAEPILSMRLAAAQQDQKPNDAIAALRRAHAAQPANTRVTLRLGEVLLRANQAEDALALAQSDHPDTELLALRASALLALGRKQEARATEADLLERDPGQIAIRRQLAALLLEANEPDAARATLTAGIALAPRNYQLHLDLALAEMQAKGLEAGLAAAEAMRIRTPDFPALAMLKADLYQAAGHPADALAALQAAQTQSPSGLIAARLAAAQRAAGQGDVAIAQLRDFLAKSPTDLDALDAMCDALLAANRTAEAVPYLEAQLRLRPRNPTAMNNLAFAYQRLGDPRASELARAAYILAPGPATADTLGWILTGKGQAANGIGYLRFAASEAPNDPAIQYHFAVALNQTGQPQQAIPHLTRALAGQFDERPQAEALLASLRGGG